MDSTGSPTHASGDAALLSRVTDEIERLHRFFDDWFTAALPDTSEAFAPIERALVSGFELVAPDGRCLPREILLRSLREAWGSRRDQPGFRIRVEAVRLRRVTDALVVAVYEEWHDGAGPAQGRSSLAVLERCPDGLRWLHVHEVALGAPTTDTESPE